MTRVAGRECVIPDLAHFTGGTLLPLVVASWGAKDLGRWRRLATEPGRFTASPGGIRQ